MFFIIGYFFLILLELVFVALFLIYTLSLIYSSLKGSPYVPTRGREVDYILNEIKPKKNQYFLDLGCGDGRIVRHAVKKYHVKGLGVDVNPLLVIYSRLLSGFKSIKNIKFKKQNIFDSALSRDFKKADYIYLFLMPKLLEKLAPVLAEKTKKDSLIISHGFRIEYFDKRLVKKINRNPFPTYFYQM